MNVTAVLDKHLVDEWRAAWKMYSLWFFATLALIPDLYNLALSSGLLEGTSAPVLVTRAINAVAFLGAASRLIKQKAVIMAAEDAAAKPTDTPS
jgi:hypothetical protein